MCDKAESGIRIAQRNQRQKPDWKKRDGAMWLGERRGESETLPVPDANPVPSTLLSPPVTCHKNRWSSAQLVVPGSRQGLMVMSPSSEKNKNKNQLIAFQSFALVQPLNLSISGSAGADWAMISCRELCFPLNIASPRLICISQGKVKESICLCLVFRQHPVPEQLCPLKKIKGSVFEVYNKHEIFSVPLVHINEKDYICWLVSQLQFKWVSRALIHSCFKQLLTHPFGTHELLLLGREETVYIHSNNIWIFLCSSNRTCSCWLFCAKSDRAAAKVLCVW